MSGVSLFRRRYQELTRRVAVAIAGTVALVLAGTSSCGVREEHLCTLIGCLGGLTVGFDGHYDPKVTYRFDISEVTSTSETLPMASCTRSTPGSDVIEIACTPTREVTSSWNGVRFPGDVNVGKIVVVVSTVEGATVVPLGSQTLEPLVSSTELNGPGCGVCTAARASVTIP